MTTSTEPALTTEPTTSGTVVVDDAPVVKASPAQTVSIVDRHPLLRKPQQYYDNTNSNKVVKTAAAAVIGVPAGIAGEIKQIFVGNPTPVAPTVAVP